MPSIEADTLKLAIKAAGFNLDDFAKKIGYSGRTGLVYQLGKDRLDFELKEKSAQALNMTVDDLFGQKDESSSQKNDKLFVHNDRSEKEELLTKLVEAQAEIIRSNKEEKKQLLNLLKFFASKTLAIEATVQTTLVHQAEIQARLEDRPFDDVLTESNGDVQEIFEGLLKGLDNYAGSFVDSSAVPVVVFSKYAS